MRSVFISYDREDVERVVDIWGDLKGLGHDAWMDRELSGGTEWWKEILRRIREGDLFVYVASSASVESQACQRELKYALALNKKILPIRISPQLSTEALPAAIQMLQVLDYGVASKAVLFQLAKALTAIPLSPPVPEPLPPEPALPASHLAVLREEVEADGPLSFESQTGLLVKLREQLRAPDEAAAVLEVLKRFRKRNDLLAIVAEEIDAILGEGSPIRSEERAPELSASGEERPPMPQQRFLNNRLTTRQAVGYATATVLLTLVLIPALTTVLDHFEIGAYRPFLLTVLSTLSTYTVFFVDSSRVGFRGSLFVRRPTATQVMGYTTAVVVLAAVVAGPGFYAIQGAFEALGIYLERVPAILVAIPFALAAGILFIAVNGFRLGEGADTS